MALPKRLTLTRERLRAALPDVSRPQRLSGLEGPVTIHRDGYGIPHIRARSEHDAFFGQGFATAQDRLWQMEYDRRRAYGRWAEAAGPSGLDGDRQMARFQILQAVQGHLPLLKPATQAMLAAYAHGVNAFLRSTARLPVEFELTGLPMTPWMAWDSLAVYMVRHILMGVWEAKVWRARLLNHLGPAGTAALYPGYPPGQPVIVPPGGTYRGPLLDGLRALAEGLSHLTFMKEGVDQGSNNWVVGGSRTASGKPLVAGDPHRALDVPGVYYQNHVACDAFDAIGFSFAGVPGFPHFAHNARVAWAITHGNGDYQDLFIERFNPAHPHQYQHGEGAQARWVEAQVTRQPIPVRGAATVIEEVARTRHGPIVAGDPRRGVGLAFCYSAAQAPNGTLDAVHDMLLARSADELEHAMRGWVDPVNNLVYADVDGAFGYRTRGRIPQRDSANGWIPVPGWDGRHEWREPIPFEEMPAVRNPPAGYCCTANNRITDERYPHYIGLEFAPGFRAQRLNEQLQGRRGLKVEDMAAIHADVVSVPALGWRPLFARLKAQGPVQERALALLAAWDGRVTRESAAPTVFHALRAQLARLLLQPLLGPLTPELFQAVDRGGNGFLQRTLARLHTEIEQERSALLPPGLTWDAALGQAFAGAVQALQKRLGPQPEQWAWERVHQTDAAHPLAAAHPRAAGLLNPRPIRMGGDADTVQAGGFYVMQGFQAHFVSVARYAFDLADWNRSTWIVPGGASGHPGSPHYEDQIALYEAHRTLPMTYDRARIAQDATTTQVLEPKKSIS